MTTTTMADRVAALFVDGKGQCPRLSSIVLAFRSLVLHSSSTASLSWSVSMASVEEMTEWLCSRCGSILGVREGKSLRLRLRKGEYLFRGAVVAVCPSCRALNEFDEPTPSQVGADCTDNRRRE